MMKAIITGGTGYVGCHLVDALAWRGVETVVLARTTAPEEAKAFVRSRSAVIREIDFQASQNVSDAFVGGWVWFHLIGSVARLRHDSFDYRHRRVTEILMGAARRAGVNRVVFLTALGTSAQARNEYHRTKWEAEREMIRSGIAGAIVRPSLICGRTVGPRNSKLVELYIRMIRESRRAVVLGNGRNRIQPIDVRDLAECMIRAGESGGEGVSVHDIGGPDAVEFRQFVRLLARALGVQVRIRTVPLWAAGIVARLLEFVQDAPAISREQVALMREDNICAIDSVERQFGFKPRALRESLATYGESQR